MEQQTAAGTIAERSFADSIDRIHAVINRIGDDVIYGDVHPTVAEAATDYAAREASRAISVAKRWTNTGVADITDPNHDIVFTILSKLILVRALHTIIFHGGPAANETTAVQKLASALMLMSLSGNTPIHTVRLVNCSIPTKGFTLPFRPTYTVASEAGWRGCELVLSNCSAPDGCIVDIITRITARHPYELLDCFGALDIMSSIRTIGDMCRLADVIGMSTYLSMFTIRLDAVTLSAFNLICRAVGTSHIKTLVIGSSKQGIARRHFAKRLPLLLDHITSAMPRLRNVVLPWDVWMSDMATMETETAWARMLAARPDITLFSPRMHLPNIRPVNAIRDDSPVKNLTYLAGQGAQIIALAMADIVDDDDPLQARPPANSAIVRDFFQSRLCDRRLLHIVADLVAPLDAAHTAVDGVFTKSETDRFLNERTWYRRHWPDTIDDRSQQISGGEFPFFFTDVFPVGGIAPGRPALRNVQPRITSFVVQSSMDTVPVPVDNTPKRRSPRLRASASDDTGSDTNRSRIPPKKRTKKN
jgi:hypothetical protein